MSAWCCVINHDWAGSLNETGYVDFVIDGCLPVIEVAFQLAEHHGRVALTFGVSPRLLDSLNQHKLQQRVQSRFDARIRGLEGLLATCEQADKNILNHDLRRLLRLQSLFQRFNGNLIKAYQDLHHHFGLSLVTAPVHRMQLPKLMSIPGGLRSQIGLSVGLFESILGFRPSGIHLGQVGFTPSIEPILAELGLSFVIVDAGALRNGSAPTVFDVYAPIQTPNHRIVAFAPDPSVHRQSSDPDHGRHADYRRMGCHGYRLAVETPERIVSLSCYGGRDARAERYCPDLALRAVRRHAETYVDDRRKYSKTLEAQMGQPPLFVADFNLHDLVSQWFEAPAFLYHMIECFERCDTFSARPIGQCLNDKVDQQVMWPGTVVAGDEHDQWASIRLPRLYEGFGCLQKAMVQKDLSGAQLDVLTVAARHLFAALELPSTRSRDSACRRAQLIRMCQHIDSAIGLLGYEGLIECQDVSGIESTLTPFDHFGDAYLTHFDARLLRPSQ